MAWHGHTYLNIAIAAAPFVLFQSRASRTVCSTCEEPSFDQAAFRAWAVAVLLLTSEVDGSAALAPAPHFPTERVAALTPWCPAKVNKPRAGCLPIVFAGVAHGHDVHCGACFSVVIGGSAPESVRGARIVGVRVGVRTRPWPCCTLITSLDVGSFLSC